MIISRYLVKEVSTTLLAVTFVLLLVFISQQMVRYLGYAAAGKIAPTILFQIISFMIPNLLALSLPLGLFLGVILAYGRLYADNELRVMHACGLSIGQLMMMTSMFVGLITVVVAVLMLWVNPLIAADKQKMLTGSSADSLLETLMPGRFQVSSDGRRVAYVEKISRSHKAANNIFIAEQEKNAVDLTGTPWIVLSAKSGYQTTDPQTHESYIVATQGNRYAGTPGQNDYRVIQFDKYAIRAPETELNSQRQMQEAISTHKLLKHHKNPDDDAELQWRFSIPLSVFLLALMAIPLSQVRPRQGRYAMLLPAILIYVVYMNLLFVGRNLIEQKTMASWMGLWWVHAIALLLIAVLYWRTRRS